LRTSLPGGEDREIAKRAVAWADNVTSGDPVAELVAKAEGQVAYWRERQAAEKCLEDGISEDGETYTPIGDEAAWQGGYCNGRMSEADWWVSTLRALAASPAPRAPAAVPEELRRLSEAATPGEWSIFCEALMRAIVAPDKCVITHTDRTSGDPWKADAYFIVSAVNYVREAIALQTEAK
jgi:hypothetical protein